MSEAKQISKNEEQYQTQIQRPKSNSITILSQGFYNPFYQQNLQSNNLNHRQLDNKDNCRIIILLQVPRLKSQTSTQRQRKMFAKTVSNGTKNNQDRKGALRQLVRGSHRNALINTLKHTLSLEKSSPDPYLSMYRKRTHSYYANKIKKPFKLVEQPEYQQQLNFTTHFNSYLNSLEQFESIQELVNPKKKLQSMEGKITKETFNPQLTMEPVASDERRKFLKQEIFVSNLHRKLNSTVQMIQNNRTRSIFPTHKTIEVKLNMDENSPRKKPRKVTVPGEINLNRKKSTISSPSKSSPRKDALNSSLRRKEERQASNSGKKQLNEEEILRRLNTINESNSKKVNFRIERTKVHDLLKNRYSNQILTTFFRMQPTEKFDGMLSMLVELMGLELKYSHLLAFLTLDINQDGLICEDDLYKVRNAISVGSIVNEDINKIIEYVRVMKTQRSQPDLPMDFVNCPTLRELRKAREQGHKAILGTSTMVTRFFSTNSFQYEREKDFGDEGGNARLPHLLKSEKKKPSRSFSINFELFQQIFKSRPAMIIADIIHYLTGIKTVESEALSRLNDKDTEEQMPWYCRKPEISEGYDVPGKKKIKIAKQKLQKMKNFYKTFSTIKYVD